MVDSYETIDFLREQKIKLGNATYIVNSHFLEQGQTLKEKNRCVTAHDTSRPMIFSFLETFRSRQRKSYMRIWASQTNIV